MTSDLRVLTAEDLAARVADGARTKSRQHPERGNLYAIAFDAFLVYENETAAGWRAYAEKLRREGHEKYATENEQVAALLESVGR